LLKTKRKQKKLMKSYRQYKNYSARAKIIAWGIDLIGGPIYKVFKAFHQVLSSTLSPSKKGIPPPLQKFLLVRLDHIGDLLMTTPAIHALKLRFPESSLNLLASPSSLPIVAGNPEIDKVFPFRVPWYDGGRAQIFPFLAYWRLLRQLRKERFDVAIDFRGDFRVLWFFLFLGGVKQRVGFAGLGGEFLLTSSFPYDKTRHFVEMNLALANCLAGPPASTGSRYHLYPTAEDVSHVDKILAELGLSAEDRIVAIHPTTIPHWQLKRWPPERFAALADALIRREGVKIVFTGGKDDAAELSRVVSAMQESACVLAGKTSLSQLAELIRRCRLFIANDTGPMHLAVAVGTPLVAIFGPTDPRRSGPYGNHELFRVVRLDLTCKRPCFVSECPIDHECMNGITPKSVLAACRDLLHPRSAAEVKTGRSAL
jgi:lipopolysaccharide heptosyltransferase II